METTTGMGNPADTGDELRCTPGKTDETNATPATVASVGFSPPGDSVGV